LITVTLIIFLLAAILALLPISSPGKISYILSGLLGGLLVLVSGFRIGSHFPDYSSYLILYDDIKTGDVIVEVSFQYIAKFVQLVFDNVLLLFFIYALIGVSLKIIAIKQLTDLWLLSLVVYIGNFFILHEMIQIRVGVASGFLLLCIKPIYDRDWKKFLLFSLLGILFHVSSLIVLPLWFLGNIKKKILISILVLIIPAAYVMYFLKVTVLNFIPIPYVQEKLDLYISLQELGEENFLNGINVFNFVYLARIVIYYFLLYKSELLAKHNKYILILLSVYGFGLFMYPALAVMPVMATRVSELLNVVEIILFPLFYYTLSPRAASKSVVIIWSLGILLINIYKSNLIF